WPRPTVLRFARCKTDNPSSTNPLTRWRTFKRPSLVPFERPVTVRSIVHKLTKGNAPDAAQMNARVREMIAEALKSDGVEEIFAMGTVDGIDIFDDDYLAKIEKIKLPNTKIKILQQLLAKAIEDFKKTNRSKGIEFTKKFQSLVDRY
ncbi:type I restriction enzyme endonuclease domain-containing protein, partial [Crateriforma conspicua]|uniref:type I restriction enzyme endonuclease domain-containing protein n=1 Tax=Crateriforma conspicua TaxID=2527996 RepID=UPI001E577DF9